MYVNKIWCCVSSLVIIVCNGFNIPSGCMLEILPHTVSLYLYDMNKHFDRDNPPENPCVFTFAKVDLVKTYVPLSEDNKLTSLRVALSDYYGDFFKEITNTELWHELRALTLQDVPIR